MPHLHAYYCEYEAVFGLQPIDLVSGDLPRTQRRLVEAWAELHHAELLADWANAVQRFVKVMPIDYRKALERMAKQNRSFAPKGDDAAAADGDRVVIDFEGFIDGVAFEGGTATEVPIEIGAGQFIPGFEDQLVGEYDWTLAACRARGLAD